MFSFREFFSFHCLAVRRHRVSFPFTMEDLFSSSTMQSADMVISNDFVNCEFVNQYKFCKSIKILLSTLSKRGVVANVEQLALGYSIVIMYLEKCGFYRAQKGTSALLIPHFSLRRAQCPQP